MKLFHFLNIVLIIFTFGESNCQPSITTHSTIEILAKKASEFYKYNTYDSAGYYASKGLTAALELGDRGEVMEISTLLAKVCNNLQKPDSAIHYYQLAYTSACEIPDSSVMASTLEEIGSVLYTSNRYIQSTGYYEESLALYKTLDDTVSVIRNLRELALLNRLQGSFTQSLDFSNQANTLAVSIGDNLILGYINNDIGIIYMENLEHGIADSFFQRSLEAVKDVSPNTIEEMVLNNRGRNQYLMGNYLAALPYLRQSYQIQINEDCGWMYPAYNLGHVFLNLGINDSASYFLNRAIKGATTCNNSYIKSLSLVDLAQLSLQQNRKANALNALQEAVDLAQRGGLKKELLFAAEHLYQLYKNEKNPAQALKYLELVQQTRDTLFNEENNRKIARLEADYSFQQEKQALEMAKERELFAVNTQLRKQKTIQIITAIGLVLSLVLVFILWRYDRLKRKANAALRNLNTQLQEKSAQILVAQDQLILQEKMASLGQLTAGIAHEIKNPMNFVNNFAMGSSELIDELKANVSDFESELSPQKTNELKELIQELKQNAADILMNGQRVDRIVQNMMDHARASSSTRESKDILPILNEQISLAYHSFKVIHGNVEVEIKKEFDQKKLIANIQANELGRAFFNVLQNAFEAVYEKTYSASEKPKLTIKTQNKKNEVLISFTDNGIGMSEEEQKQGFTPFFTTKKDKSNSIGLGLSICYDIVVTGHQGKITIESKQGYFTTVNIVLPKQNKTL